MISPILNSNSPISALHSPADQFEDVSVSPELAAYSEWDWKAFAFEQEGDYENALYCLNQALDFLSLIPETEFPNKSVITMFQLMQRLELHAKLDQLKEVIVDAQEYFEIFSTLYANKPEHAKTGEYFKGFCYLALGNESEGAPILKKFAEEGNITSLFILKLRNLALPNPNFSPNLDPDIWGIEDPDLMESIVLFQAQQYEEVVRFLNSIPEDQPEALQLRAAAKVMLNDFSGAIQDYDAVLSRGYDARAFDEKAIVYSLMGDRDQAKTILQSIYLENGHFRFTEEHFMALVVESIL